MKKTPKLPRRLFGVLCALVLSARAFSPASAQVPVADGSVRFLAFGDWGYDGKSVQLPVAEQMGRTAAAARSQFVVVLGDNFYNDGVSSVESRQWTTSFEDVYTAPALQIPWYVALGNHDYHTPTNARAELEYTLFSPRWKMPARYYTFIRRIDAKTTVEFFMLDSTPYKASYRKNFRQYGDILTQNPEAQTAWLEAELKKSTAQWKIACAHHPIRSVRGGRSDTPELVAKVEPLLEKYGVQIYLNGHEHDFQHLRNGKIDFFCSGAGALPGAASSGAGEQSETASPRTEGVPKTTNRDSRTLFSLGRTGGFLDVVIDPDTFRGRFVDYTGKEVYATTISRVPAPAP